MADAGGSTQSQRAGAAVDAARRQLRAELRVQQQEVIRQKEVLCDLSTNNNKLDEAIRRSDKLLDKGEGIQRAKEVAVAAELFRNLTECNDEVANKLVQKQGRGPMDLVVALRAAFVRTSNPQRDGEEDPWAFSWSEMAASAEHLRRPARGMSCMMGPLDTKPKERKAPVARQKRAVLGELQKPDELENIVEKEAQETDRNMEIMWRIIKEQEDPVIGMPELVLNPSSFGQTVENIFTLSFLVKDNLLALLDETEGEGRGVCVRRLPGKPGTAAAVVGPGGQPAAQQQLILSFHMDDWNEWKRYVAPEACLMPHRQKEQQQEGGGQKRHQREGEAAGPSAGKAKGNKKARTSGQAAAGRTR